LASGLSAFVKQNINLFSLNGYKTCFTSRRKRFFSLALADAVGDSGAGQLGVEFGPEVGDQWGCEVIAPVARLALSAR